MRYWTNEEKNTIRLGIIQLAEDEYNQRKLNQWQLTLIFKILSFGLKVDYDDKIKRWTVIEYWFGLLVIFILGMKKNFFGNRVDLPLGKNMLKKLLKIIIA